MTASSWVTGALLIGAVFAFMLFRERWRLRALEAWAVERRFKFMCPFVPEGQLMPPMTHERAALGFPSTPWTWMSSMRCCASC